MFASEIAKDAARLLDHAIAVVVSIADVKGKASAVHRERVEAHNIRSADIRVVCGQQSDPPGWRASNAILEPEVVIATSSGLIRVTGAKSSRE
jgi:hypothetical protein